MPLSYALTTTSRVKTFLSIGGTTYDSLISTLIDSCTDYIEKYCDRRFKQATYTDEVYTASYGYGLYLKNTPVSSITSIQERGGIENINSWQNIHSNKYYYESLSGKITRIDAPFVNTPQHYRATYVGGYNFDNSATFLSDVGAADLEMAVWMLVGKVFNDRKNNGSIKSESIGDYSVTFAREAFADKQIMDILNNYRKTFVG